MEDNAEGWITVQSRKTKKNLARSSRPVEHDYDSFDTHQSDSQDWKPVVLHKKPEAPKKWAATPGEGYVTVATGRVGQRSDYDPRKQAKIANETESFKIRRVGRDTANQIQQARQALKITQKDLAHKMNVPLTVVSQYENGSAVYDGAMFQKFKKALNF